MSAIATEHAIEDQDAARRQRWIDGFRSVAELFDSYDLPEPISVVVYGYDDERPMRLGWFFQHNEADEFAQAVRNLPKAGPVRKRAGSDGTWSVEIDVAGYPVKARVAIAGVCELVEVGVEEYEDTEVLEEYTVVRTRPKIERRCPESLLALVGEDPTDEVPA